MTKRSRHLSSARSCGALGAVLLAVAFVACATVSVVPIDKPEDASVPDATSDAGVDADADAKDADADAEDEDADAG